MEVENNTNSKVEDKQKEKQNKETNEKQEKEKDLSIDDNQISILNEILEEKNKPLIKVKIPKDEFRDEFQTGGQSYKSSGTISGETNSKSKIIKKCGYTFNINGFEMNSIAYFNEILLGNKNKNNCIHVNFNFNELLSLDKATIDICKKMFNQDFELVGDIDGIILNVENDDILKAKSENRYSIFTSQNFFKNKNDIYDIFCESTFGLMGKLVSETKKSMKKKNLSESEKNKQNVSESEKSKQKVSESEKNSQTRNEIKKNNRTISESEKNEKNLMETENIKGRKILQINKLIYLIKFINEINNEIGENSDKPKKDLRNRINKIFKHKPKNKIIICIIVDGNYKDLVRKIKFTCLFSKNWKDTTENEEMKGLFDYFKALRVSQIPFMIVYCPRFYERNSSYFNPISKIYEEDKNADSTEIINTFINENAKLNQKIKDLEKKLSENAKLNQKIKDLEKKLSELEANNKKKEEKIFLKHKRKRKLKKIAENQGGGKRKKEEIEESKDKINFNEQ